MATKQILQFGNHGVVLPVVALGEDEDLTDVDDYVKVPTASAGNIVPLVVVEFNTSADVDQVVIAARYDGTWVEVAEVVEEVENL